jgi:hypothetical protein
MLCHAMLCYAMQESTSGEWTACTARLTGRVIQCYAETAAAAGSEGRGNGREGGSGGGKTPLFRYEITERTVVRLHEEGHFSAPAPPAPAPAPPSRGAKRDASGEPLPGQGQGQGGGEGEAAPRDERLRFAFYVNQLDDKGGGVTFLEFATPVDLGRLSWKHHIELSKHEYKRVRQREAGLSLSPSDLGLSLNRIAEWKLSPESIAQGSAHSSVSTLLALRGAVRLRSTALCSLYPGSISLRLSLCLAYASVDY